MIDVVLNKKRHNMFMEMAMVVKRQATCSRNQVGCVITDSHGTSVVAMGYNGNAAGAPNACDRANEPGNCGCIHAEVNALIKAPYHVASDLVMYTTTAPCIACAKLIVNSRVGAVFFFGSYRNNDGVRFLLHMDITLAQAVGNDNGGIIFEEVFDASAVKIIENSGYREETV